MALCGKDDPVGVCTISSLLNVTVRKSQTNVLCTLRWRIARQSIDTINVAGQIPVVDAEGALQAGCWLPPSDAIAPFSYALEPLRQREVTPAG
jgi:hypothetical protein